MPTLRIGLEREDLLAEFEIDATSADEEVPANFDVAPTKISPAVVARSPRDAKDDKNAEPVRQLRNLKWGLVASWAKDPKIGNRMINGRAEAVHENPAFKRAFSSRRLALPIEGFFERFPTTQVDRSGKPAK